MTKSLVGRTTIELSKETKDMFEKLKKHSKDVSLIVSMKLIGNSYRKEVGMIFERKQVREPSLRWPPLNKKYATRKRKKYGEKPILQATGNLKKSMTEKGALGNINITRKFRASFGSSIDYGNYHDDIKEPRSKIPLRNFSLPSKTTYGTWEMIIDSDIKGQLNRIQIDTEN